MGLLEKAGKISDEDKKEEKPVATVAKVEPEPVPPSRRNLGKRHLKNQRRLSPRHQRPQGRREPNLNPRLCQMDTRKQGRQEDH